MPAMPAAPAAAGPVAFSELACLSPPTLAVLHQQGFTQCTPVQEATLPLFCGNKDVSVEACTGSGKTLAYVLPIIEKLRRLEEKLRKHQVGAIIVSPTRELAKQIFSVAAPFIDSVPDVKAMLLVGGTAPGQDVLQFKDAGAQLLVGTPGRIDDMLKRCPIIELRKLEVLVLDEADRLLDMGFRLQLDSIMARLPKQRRTGLFSATQTEAVQALARAGLRNPVRVQVTVSVVSQPQPPMPTTAAAASAAVAGGSNKRKALTAAGAGAAADVGHAHASGGSGGGGGGEGGLPAGVTQATPSSLHIQYVLCEADEKLAQLACFLQAHQDAKILVYFLTCAVVDYYALVLPKLPAVKALGLHIAALHGKMKQGLREAALDAFAAQPAGVLLCTDLAARGLDIPDVHWIVQYDPPQDPSAFVHRVGRTARMGRSGNALALLLPSEEAYIDFLRLRKVPLTEGALLAGPPTSQDVLPLLRHEASTDREIMEKGTRAFVSYIRGYKEHHCKFIFRLPDLDVGRLANSYGLLRLPRMPDLKRPKGMEAFQQSPLHPDTVPFKDKAREKQRQKLLKEKSASRAADDLQPDRKRTAAAAAATAAAAAAAAAEAARMPSAKRRQLQQRDELMDLEFEYGLLRKLKKGKISNHAFDVATGLSSGDEEDEELAAIEAAAAAEERQAEGKITKHGRGEQVGKLGAGGKAGKDVGPGQGELEGGTEDLMDDGSDVSDSEEEESSKEAKGVKGGSNKNSSSGGRGAKLVARDRDGRSGGGVQKSGRAGLFGTGHKQKQKLSSHGGKGGPGLKQKQSGGLGGVALKPGSALQRFVEHKVKKKKRKAAKVAGKADEH